MCDSPGSVIAVQPPILTTRRQGHPAASASSPSSSTPLLYAAENECRLAQPLATAFKPAGPQTCVWFSTREQRRGSPWAIAKRPSLPTLVSLCKAGRKSEAFCDSRAFSRGSYVGTLMLCNFLFDALLTNFSLLDKRNSEKCREKCREKSERKRNRRGTRITNQLERHYPLAILRSLRRRSVPHRR
jgi:hypothetical protein